MGALGKSYDLAVSQKELLKSSSIEEKLKMTTNNCQKTLEEYNKIVKNEEQAENRYYYDKDNYITISGVGRVKVKNSQFYSIGNLYQPDILDYIDKGPYLAHKNFDDYFKNINDMIANEYTDTEKYTLRTFLESKGFNIPSEARYLIAGNTKVEARNYAIYKIPLYDLDKSTTEIEDYKYYSYTGGWGGGSTYYNNDKLCYFLDKATSTSDCLATLSDTNEGETVYCHRFKILLRFRGVYRAGTGPADHQPGGGGCQPHGKDHLPCGDAQPEGLRYSRPCPAL